ncbi:hypothetical protein Ddc_06259 [Ditylenchus destructor]|nr:hypothetical protein Ddc_06259 [Ditylenchus destructor]
MRNLGGSCPVDQVTDNTGIVNVLYFDWTDEKEPDTTDLANAPSINGGRPKISSLLDHKHPYLDRYCCIVHIVRGSAQHKFEINSSPLIVTNKQGVGGCYDECAVFRLFHPLVERRASPNTAAAHSGQQEAITDRGTDMRGGGGRHALIDSAGRAAPAPPSITELVRESGGLASPSKRMSEQRGECCNGVSDCLGKGQSEGNGPCPPARHPRPLVRHRRLFSIGG